MCVFIFFHREGFFRLQNVQDILEGTDQRSCVVNISWLRYAKFHHRRIRKCHISPPKTKTLLTFCYHKSLPDSFPATIYLLKVSNRNINRCEICSKFSMKIPEQRQWQANISRVPGEYGKLSSISSCFLHALGFSYICWEQNSLLQWLLLHLCLFFFSLFFIFSFFCKIIIFQILIAIEFVVKGFTASCRSLVL